MAYAFQPVILSYGLNSGDAGQDIPVLNPSVGGEGLHIYFSKEHKDPKGHHGNSGGISVLNGEANVNGSWAQGTLNLWLVDLWAQGPYGSRTEVQIWPSRVKILGDGSSAVGDVSNDLLRRMGVEFYAPYQHDDLVWDSDGNVSKNEPGHWASVRHTAYNFNVECPPDERLRFNIAQWHGGPNVPSPYNKPYPGYIKYAVLHMQVWPM